MDGNCFAAEPCRPPGPAGASALVVTAVLGEHWILPHSPRVWWAWAYLVVFGSMVAFSAYRFLVERVSPTLATTYAYVNPPVGALAALKSALGPY